jgi:hypothetical protein
MALQMNPVKQAIKTYLDNRAKTDELFAVAYAKPNKNIDECFNYVVGEARKQGGNAVYVPDEVVFGWAVHYYDEDNLIVEKQKDYLANVPEPKVKLTDEEKAEAKEQAMKEYRTQCIAMMQQKQRDELKEKKATAKKQREEAKHQEVLTLFDL